MGNNGIVTVLVAAGENNGGKQWRDGIVILQA